MTVLVGEVVDRARALLLDQIGLDYPDADFLRWVNDAALDVAAALGEASTAVVVAQLERGARQTLPPDAIRLVDVPRNMLPPPETTLDDGETILDGGETTLDIFGGL
ncbi:DUF6682 family protein [Methylomagnum ishizawai]|uniref:phage adaptor protein n=1 Tax=Methylomagnum ishizawai TaxID=1760988 RepID=UPI001C3363F9|nr:DUF6682 family protein [Methylomagnum ishizawai]BBL74179.1 hypothetical protein MishRS11D_12770 [Methylomagnum ishizawai]